MGDMKKESKTILSQIIALSIVIILLVASRFYDEIKQNNPTERNKLESILSSSSVEKAEWQNEICSMGGTFGSENNCELLLTNDETKGNTNAKEGYSYLEKKLEKLEVMISVEEKEKKKHASWFDRVAESYIFTQYNKILLFLFCLPLVPNPFKGKIISVTLYVEDFDFSSLLEEIAA